MDEIVQAVDALFLAMQPLEQLLAVGREQAKLTLALPRRFQSEETLHFPAAQTRVAQGVQQRLRLTNVVHILSIFPGAPRPFYGHSIAPLAAYIKYLF